MQIPSEGVLLRIFLGESDTWKGRPLYEAIVHTAREMRLAGATVLRGPMGFGANSHMHTAKVLRLSVDLPIVIEIVESEENAQRLLKAIEPMMGGGLVTMEKARIIRYAPGEERREA